MPDDDGKPTFDEIKDAMMPPGTDREALWAALKGAHRTGGYAPGQQAPDISGDPEAGLPKFLRKMGGGGGSADYPGPPYATGGPGARAYFACTICGRVHDKHLPCADLSIPDPFTKGSEAAAGLAEMYEDLLASGIPLSSVERILGAMLATYGLMTKDEP